YVASLQPHQHGFASVEDFFLALPEYFVLSGPKDRRMVHLAKDTGALDESMDPPTDSSESLPSFSVASSLSPLPDYDHEQELLELRLSPEDLLNDPIPSGIPSPDISPEVPSSDATRSDGVARDLIKFDPPPN
ncbi:unnamed protein product, partial [Ixodes hexagonus]